MTDWPQPNPPPFPADDEGRAPERRCVWLTRDQRDLLAHAPRVVDQSIVAAWDAAPADPWAEIADEFQRHRCKDGNCFAEAVLLRLGWEAAREPA